MEEKETFAEDNITCPNCKEVTHSDSWEISDDEGDDVCDFCGVEYSWVRDVSVTYSSELKINK